jgi:hypothetical protein
MIPSDGNVGLFKEVSGNAEGAKEVDGLEDRKGTRTDDQATCRNEEHRR